MKTARIIVALLLTASLPTVSLAAGEMKEGLWELTTSMELPGMPMKMPPQVAKHCYTREEVSDQKKVISRDKECTVTDFTTTGNKVTWKMTCTGKNAGTFSGETVFKADSYVSNMKMQTQGQNMTMKVNAKRLGNCK
ncbi:MAG: DUF3617 family protein [Desulfuromonadales bacterium]|nr:DUF3617 family protein [Desulfuromonadales bacterium]